MAKNEGTNVIVSGPGIGIVGALTITFVILKSLGYLSWSWWWVFSPLWISAGLSIFIIGIILLIAYLASR